MEYALAIGSAFRFGIRSVEAWLPDPEAFRGKPWGTGVTEWQNTRADVYPEFLKTRLHSTVNMGKT